MIRINPTKMLVGGNQRAAKNFLGPARSQLEILKNQMSFQNLSQGVRKIWLNDDVYVECRKIFNYQECRVWVRPISGEEEQVLQDVYFFVRIFHPGWFPVSVIQGDWRPNLCSEYGQTFDQNVVRVPDLKMDRLIFWEPVLENETTIVPGQGAVVLDVDLVNDIVYFVKPDFPFADDSEATLAWARNYLDRVHYDGVQVQTDKRHPGWDTWPKVVETPDMKEEWLRTGYISAPDYNYFMCGNGYGHDGAEPEIIIAMDEYFDPDDSGNYYHMMTPIMPDETGEINPIELETWRHQWCVEYGGDPEQLYTARLWPKLEVNAEHYPETIIPKKASGTYQVCFQTGETVGPYPPAGIPIYFRALHCAALGDPLYVSAGVTNGIYVTGRNEERKFPSFFCYISTRGAGASNQGEFAYQLDGVWYGGGKAMDFGYSSAYGVGRGVSLVTPLEAIPFSEICLISGQVEDGSRCMPAGVDCLSYHDNIFVNISSEVFEKAGSLVPCSAPEGVGVAGRKMTTVVDNQIFRGITIPDPDQLNANLFAFSVHIDRSVSVQAAEGFETYWSCEGVVYSNGTDLFQDCVPRVISNEFGVVYYLMNPQDFWWANADTGEIEFWDIHSIRETNPDEINSYRLLDLEDYVNNILLTLRNGIRAYPTTDLDIDDPAGTLVGGLPKYPNTTDGYYSLMAYGYYVTDGFVYK